MKKTILLLISLFQYSLYSIAQMPSNGDFSNWNWENQDPANWTITEGEKTRSLPPPFAPVKP